MQSSGNNGVIVVSMGTLLKFLPNRTLDIIASTLARFPQKSIVSYKGSLPLNTNNTMFVTGFPQNDLLGMQ